MSENGKLTHKELKAVLSAYDESIPKESPAQVARKERTKSREMQKKMGGGKKGMWGKPEDVITIPKIDKGDPNFDSEGEENVILVPDKSMDYVAPSKLTLSEFKKEIVTILQEYFVSGDTEEVGRSLVELDSAIFHYEVVKRAITLSLEKREKEREMVSRLLSEMYPDILTTTQVGKGFERLLEIADDLELDTPDARTMLSTFLARAVVDEILPPSFLMDPMIIQLGGDIVDSSKKKLSINHGAARLEKGWGPGDGRPVEELKVAIDQLLQEYILSGDLTEAARCVRELNVPHFHHEVVKRAITNGMESDRCSEISSFLAYLVTQEVLCQKQLIQGIDRIKQTLSDLQLDIPTAPNMVATFIERAKKDEILPMTYPSL